MIAEECDIVVIGGGTSGIVFARFYLDIHPKSRLIVIERDGVIGGTWSKERIYDGFWAQAGANISGFSDIPFRPSPDHVDKNGFFDAQSMSEYLENYIDQHTYAGKTLRERVILNTNVTRLEKVDNLWSVSCQKLDGTAVSFSAAKVVVANGGTSEPNWPNFPGEDIFKGQIVHTMNFGKSSVLSNPNVNKVSVLGGGKSAADLVYQAVKAGKAVSWIIRSSGKGPGCFISPQGFWRYENVVEAGMSRLVGALLFAGLGKQNWWSRLMFKTRFGTWLYSKIEGLINQQALKDANFDGREEAKESFKLLKPEDSAMWLLSPAGMIHHEDFWEVVSKKVDIYRADIQGLTETSINFTDGRVLECDAILLGTGFGEKFSFLPQSQIISLGLPHDTFIDTSTVSAEWEALEDAATKQILAEHPILKSQPRLPNNLGDISSTNTPYRLYNSIAPVTDKSIVFLGFAEVPNMFLISELQSVWGTAWLDGKLDLGDDDKLKKDVARTTAYSRLRCPTYGKKGNFFVFDFFNYVDKLLDELGFVSPFKGKGWWHMLTDPLVMSDLRGLRDEYREKYGYEEDE